MADPLVRLATHAALLGWCWCEGEDCKALGPVCDKGRCVLCRGETEMGAIPDLDKILENS